MKNLFYLFFSFLFFLISFQAQAQYVRKQADKEFELYNFTKAIDLYERAFKQKATLHVAERLALSYKQVFNYKQTESWYGIATRMPNTRVENILGYAKALQSNSKYGDAKIQYLKYIDLAKEIPLNQQAIWIASCDSAIKWMQTPKNVEILNQKALNSPQADWGAVKYGSSTVFTSDRLNVPLDHSKTKKPFLKFDGGANVPDKKVYGWTGHGYLKLYVKTIDSDGITPFPLNTETNYHVGAPSFTTDGNTMYFTLTRVPEDLSKLKGKPSTINVEVFSSQKENGVWSKPVAFEYNNLASFSVGDPFISGDGKTLFFSSNMPGGRGGTDIYMCAKTVDGKWSKPLNMLDVNTPGNERSPAFDDHKNFYFASDGRVGMGGLDIFKAKFEESKITEIANLGYPFNSPQDDFGFSLNDKGRLAFLSSNRTDGAGTDDIYGLVEQVASSIKLNGTVFNKSTNQPLPNAIVLLKNDNGSTLKVLTDDGGNFKFDVYKNSSYNLLAEKTTFQTDRALISTHNLEKNTLITKNLYLTPFELNKPIRIENIYYDFDKWYIRKDAAYELDKLVVILEDNPTIWVELGSHTDSRGNDSYNLNLSQKRAESAVRYIVSKGIDKNRITAKGYGETQLVNGCSNGATCSEVDHQLNRRTELKIVKE